MRINRAALAIVLAAALSPSGLDAQKLTRVAMDGTPQIPVAGKLRTAPATNPGPPVGPAALRVSANRQGVTV